MMVVRPQVRPALVADGASGRGSARGDARDEVLRLPAGRCVAVRGGCSPWFFWNLLDTFQNTQQIAPKTSGSFQVSRTASKTTTHPKSWMFKTSHNTQNAIFP